MGNKPALRVLPSSIKGVLQLQDQIPILKSTSADWAFFILNFALEHSIDQSGLVEIDKQELETALDILEASLQTCEVDIASIPALQNLLRVIRSNSVNLQKNKSTGKKLIYLKVVTIQEILGAFSKSFWQKWPIVQECLQQSLQSAQKDPNKKISLSLDQARILHQWLGRFKDISSSRNGSLNEIYNKFTRALASFES